MKAISLLLLYLASASQLHHRRSPFSSGSSSSPQTSPQVLSDNQYYNSSSGSDSAEIEVKDLLVPDRKGCGGKLGSKWSPLTTGALLTASIALTIAYTVWLVMTNRNFEHNCRGMWFTDDKLLDCYPEARQSVVTMVASIEPVHILVDLALFFYSIVYILFARGKTSPVPWHWLIGAIAWIALTGRIIGVGITSFTLPGKITDSLTTGGFNHALTLAAGVFGGFEMAFLCSVVFALVKDLNNPSHLD